MNNDRIPGCVASIVASWCLIGVIVGFSTCSSGCGGVRVTSYTIETARCAENQEAIVRREGTTEEQDLEDFEAELARCAAALEAIRGMDGGTP